MDSLCLKAGISSPAIAVAGSGAFELRSNPSQVSAMGRAAAAGSAISAEKPPPERASPPSPPSPMRKLFFGYPLRSLWPGGGRRRYNGTAVDDAVLVEERERAAEGGAASDSEAEGKNENWVLKILHVRSRWTGQGKDRVEDLGEGEEREEISGRKNGGFDNGEEEEDCDVCHVDADGGDEEKEEVDFDRDSFSRLLRRVTLTEAKLYAQMSYLGNLAYNIPNIKLLNLLRYYKLQFITSSLEKKELSTKSEKNHISSILENKDLSTESDKAQISPEVGEAEAKPEEAEGKPEEPEDSKEQKNTGYRISASVAYQIAANAASYLHTHTKGIIAFKSSKGKACEEPAGEGGKGNDHVDIMNSEVASLMATTDSVTAVVAAKEEVKQAVADNLNSTCSSPCEWFICDDDETATRFFVIQGSESLASWQANLLFEPIQFEGLDVLVHRGIYEAAKGIYDQMLPEVCAHLKSHGNRATFRFTGHSLGGSLALLVNLMLLIRGEVPLSLLLPVITFGSPSIMCGGDRLLRKLGLPKSHVQAITMHRDIVPRAFSCNYPNHVAELLKAVNGNFRNHPCLNNQKLLYAPMGELLILQPEEKISPHHHLLPPGSGIYLLCRPLSDAGDAERQIMAAQTTFLNSPHPLEILRDRSSYGSDGAIQRDHDMNSYLKSVRGVVRQELNRIRKARREHRRKAWWPLVMPRGMHASVMVGRPMGLHNKALEQFNYFGILQTGRQSLKRFTRLVASQHMHLLVVLLFPARLLVLGAFSGIKIFH